MVDIKASLDLNDMSAEAFLGGIQGNIIKGHGRDFTAHLICRMTGDASTVRTWISAFSAGHVTSANAARRQTATWASFGGPGEEFAMFLLSAEGYRFLGFADAELPGRNGVPDPYFVRGMKLPPPPPRRFNDPPTTSWEAPYQSAVHAMVLLADDDLGRLNARVATIEQSLGEIMEVLRIERGAALRKTFPEPRGALVIEHFGFQDGVSQPIMIKQDADREKAERGSTNYNPEAPLELALLGSEAAGYGSFMVFRKLEQDVKGFHAAVARVASETGHDVRTIAAMAVGRHEDGTPVIPTTVVAPNADPNDFHFNQDPPGAICPFHAHIRKTNPRGDIKRYLNGTDEFERQMRIVRRGITYGDRPDLVRSDLEPPGAGVGLLFMCFQSSLDQFGIQQEGSDEDGFVIGGVGVDATIGQTPAPTPLPQTWPSTGTKKATMANLVTMLGGEYFFAPSLPFLLSLAKPAA